MQVKFGEPPPACSSCTQFLNAVAAPVLNKSDRRHRSPSPYQQHPPCSPPHDSPQCPTLPWAGGYGQLTAVGAGSDTMHTRQWLWGPAAPGLGTSAEGSSRSAAASASASARPTPVPPPPLNSTSSSHRLSWETSRVQWLDCTTQGLGPRKGERGKGSRTTVPSCWSRGRPLRCWKWGLEAP